MQNRINRIKSTYIVKLDRAAWAVSCGADPCRKAVPRVNKGHPRVTIGHLRVTIGHLRVTLGHLRVTLGHLRVTISYFLSIDK